MSAREQHLATRRAAGLFDFSFMGHYELASVRGVQSRDLEHLELGQIAYTLLLNDDGSVFNDATAWRLATDRWWLFTGRRSDTERLHGISRNRSGEYAIAALQGSKRVWDSLLSAGRGDGLVECGFEAANSLRIESGFVLFDREIDGRANPLELGLERLAPNRTFRATRKLVGLKIEEGQADESLPRAHLTSQCDSPSLEKGIALGFAAPDARPGDFVRLNNAYLGRVVPLPFFDPERRRPRIPPHVGS